MKNKLFLSVCAILLLCSWQGLAQKIDVRGTVTSADDGESLPGVSIIVKGTQQGTVTRIDGGYKIQVPPGSVLQYSFIGFVTREIAVNNQNVIDLALEPDIEQLDEVVVVGYGTQKKSEVIGSVATVKSEEILAVPAPSLVEGLQGKATGVHISSSSGVPGAKQNIKIRGLSSISSGTNPLWIIDGMPIYSGDGLEEKKGATRQDPMSLINPNDIESIEVLKDAAATAIYGSRGSNGVIIITTKSGKKGKGSLSIDYSGGVSELTRTNEDVGFTNTTEWFGLVEQARRNSNQGDENPYNPLSITGLFRDDPTFHVTREEAMQINTDWFDQIFRTGSFHDLNISSTRGGEKSSYFLSVNYREDESVLKSNALRKISTRANLNFEPINNLKLGTKLNFSYSQNNRVKVQGGGGIGSNGGGTNGGFGNANRNALPWFPIYNSDVTHGYWNPLSGNNLNVNIDPNHMHDVVDQYRGIGGLFAEYSLPWVSGLSIRSEASIDYIQNSSIFWTSDVLNELGSYAFDRSVTRTSLNYNLYASYNRVIADKHSVNAVFGTESQETRTFRRQMEGRNLTGSYKQLGNPQDMLAIFSGLTGELYIRAFFGRANYTFNQKYMAGVSFRRDGVSKFEPEFRWGNFTAFSLGWMISEETFMESFEFIETLKLRGSFGQTGNQNIPANKTITTYENRGDWRYGSLDFINGGTRTTNIGNPTITWEVANSYDGGIDYGLWGNRINGSLAYYVQYVDDLLLASPLATSAGVQKNQLWANIGDMRNYGIEFDVNAINVDKPDFRWTTKFNITTNDTEILRLTPDVDRAGGGIIKDGQKLTRTGGRLQAFFMAEDAGVDPERGVNMIWEIDRDLYEETGETVKTGRKIPATFNNLQNNRFIHEDKTPFPRFFGGLGNTFEYKGFDLNVFFNFSAGAYIYDYDEQRTTDVQYGQVVLRKDLIGNSWTPDNPNAKYPELRWQGVYDWNWDPNVENSESPTGKGDWIEGSGNYKNEAARWTKYLHKSDYIRLRTLQLGYNFRPEIAQKLKLQSLRVYVTGTNLWTYTNYEGWDPETGGGVLPPVKMYSGGISVKL